MLGPFSFGTARERLISALKEVEGERKMVLVGVSLGGGQVVLDLIRGEPGSS
jgi:predicted alpha/beta-fold hydrolase